MSHHRFIIGHVLDALRTLPDGSVHCVVTSPPYFGLRNYGIPSVAWPEVEYSPMPGLPPLKVPAWEGQLGLEPTPEMYVGHLVLVFREVKRILRKDGTCWVVIGDSYAGSWGNYGAREGKQRSRIAERWHRPAYEDPRHGWNGLPPTAKPTSGLKEKDLIGVPWRLAFALQADGWWLRSVPPWLKLNAPPESVRDRPTLANESILFLTKSKRYYYDVEAVKVPCRSGPSDIRKMLESRPRLGGKHRILEDAFSRASAATNMGRKRSVGSPAGRNRRTTDWWEESVEVAIEELLGLAAQLEFARNGGPLAGNDGQIVSFMANPEGYHGDHFAVFPRRLVEPCLMAGTSPKACPACSAPWQRVTGRLCEKCGAFIPTQGKSCARCGHVRNWKVGRVLRREMLADDWSTPGRGVPRLPGGSADKSVEAGWCPTCSCPSNDGSGRCVVLDPFGGAGTTTLAAASLGRDSIYIDLKKEYAEMALERCGFGENKLFDQHTWEVVELDVAQDIPARAAE